MKKFVLASLHILAYATAYALPVGNPSEPDFLLCGAWLEPGCPDPCNPCFRWCEAWSLRTGFYGDYVFNRHLETAIDNKKSHVDEAEIFTNAAYFALNFFNRVDLFGTLGASNIHVRSDARAWDFVGSLESELFFRTDLSWSIGGRGILWKCDCFAVGLEGQYFQTAPQFRNFIEYNDGSLTHFGTRAKYTEWQVGSAISYLFCSPNIIWIPYAGIKLAGAHFTLDRLLINKVIGGSNARLTFYDLQSSKSWGFALGMSITLCKVIGVTVEGRFADEKACYVNASVRL